MNINDYANEKLMDFLDGFHGRMVSGLKEALGNDWLEKGVRKHFSEEGLSRTKNMLSNPMRVVDMGKSTDDIYGIEHLSNIVNGNWDTFGPLFGDRARATGYLGEITELRNNLAHRRKEHIIRRVDLIRFIQNAQILLDAIKSPIAKEFHDILDSLLSGVDPWGGRPIEVQLPPHDEIYDEFLGRSDQLRELLDWFTSDSKQRMVWGYGGVGKSALAHKFAQEIRDIASDYIDAIVWLTAKKIEYVERSTKERIPDFEDVPTFCNRIVNALYGSDRYDVSKDEMLSELRNTRCLLIVDDLDTVIDDQDTAEMLLFELRPTASKVLFTSRQQIPGIRYMEVPPFDDETLQNFIAGRAGEYGVDENVCLKNIVRIRAVTQGYPLFVDDLIRYAALVGVKKAIEEWEHRKGDGARVYALRRQLERLGGVTEDTLISIAVGNRPLRVVEISQVGGLADDDVESGVTTLLSSGLIHRVDNKETSEPAYSINSNTRRLVRSTFAKHPKLLSAASAYKGLTGERTPEAKRIAIGKAIREAKKEFDHSGIETAADKLVLAMTGELRDDADLYGMLGWVYARNPQQFRSEAQEAFKNAHKFGSRKPEMYFHWTELEIRSAEQAVWRDTEENILGFWRNAIKVSQLALERCEESDGRCHRAGYLRSREAKTLDNLNQFSQAKSARYAAVDLFRRALKAPPEEYPVPRSRIYRGLALSYDELDDIQALTETLRIWHAVSSTDPIFVSEVRRIYWRRPALESDLAWLSKFNQARP